MDMELLAMRGGWWTFAKALRERKAFAGATTASDARRAPLHGNPRDPLEIVMLTPESQLPTGWAFVLRDSLVDYIVWDYDTPIAWHEAGNPDWIIPPVKYSKTTTRHQNLMRTACAHVAEADRKKAERERAMAEPPF
jgi:hypothetical protein